MLISSQRPAGRNLAVVIEIATLTDRHKTLMFSHGHSKDADIAEHCKAEARARQGQ